MNPRVVKPQTPPRLIVASVGIGLLILGFVVFSVWYSGRNIMDAKMTGTIVEKEFVPAPEQQIVLGREGSIKAREKEGDYILVVEVPQRGGEKKTFRVFLNKKLYDTLQVGQSFDVGPYVVPEKN